MDQDEKMDVTPTSEQKDVTKNKRKGFVSEAMKSKLLFWRTELDQATAKNESASVAATATGGFRNASRSLPAVAPLKLNESTDIESQGNNCRIIISYFNYRLPILKVGHLC